VERGDLYLAKNEVDKAIAEYRAGTKAAPNAAIAYFKLGTIYEAQRKWGDAEQAYLAALKGDPGMYGAYNNLAWMAAARKERLNDALSWINKAIQIAPRATTLYDTLGWVHRARGELDPAAKAIEKAVAGTPTHPRFRYHLGIVYSEQGKIKEAIAAFQRALELDENFRDAADARKQLEKLRAK
jgi:superkiller protein 3